MAYPRLVRIRQQFDREVVGAIESATRAALEKLDLAGAIRPGHTVALTAGSRGIAAIARIIKAVADHLKKLGAKPFIIPAMGSHGGGTAEGQRKIIESYGITEDFVGVPIRASMDVVKIADTAAGFPVYLDRHAHGADHIGVIGRV